MWRSKKFIVAMVVVGAILVGSISGIVVLADDNGDEGQTETQCEALWDRVCEIYQEQTGVAIDQEALKDAVAQAKDEVKTEALQNYLNRLVEEGEITQEEADEYLEWWQAKPDVSIGPGHCGNGRLLRIAGLCALMR